MFNSALTETVNLDKRTLLPGAPVITYFYCHVHFNSFSVFLHFFRSVLVRNSAISALDSHERLSLLPKQPRFRQYTIDQPRFQANIPSHRMDAWHIDRIFPIWLEPVGYKELAWGLEPIRNGEIHFK